MSREQSFYSFIALREKTIFAICLLVYVAKQKKCFYVFFPLCLSLNSGQEDIQSRLWRGEGKMELRSSWKIHLAQRPMVRWPENSKIAWSPRTFLSMSYLSSFAVASFRGEVLKLTKIARNEMGSYLCIASNSVPPSVSKRISLNIHCKFIDKLNKTDEEVKYNKLSSSYPQNTFFILSKYEMWFIFYHHFHVSKDITSTFVVYNIHSLFLLVVTII